MHGDVGDFLRGQEEADGEVGEGRQGEGGGVADGGGAGRDGDGGAPAEGEDVGGGEGDVACGAGEGDVGGGDGEGLGAELVRELDADERAAEGEVDGLAEGGVGGEEGGAVGAIWIRTIDVGAVDAGGGPGADPVVGGWGGLGGLGGEGSEGEEQENAGGVGLDGHRDNDLPGCGGMQGGGWRVEADPRMTSQVNRDERRRLRACGRPRGGFDG